MISRSLAAAAAAVTLITAPVAAQRRGPDWAAFDRYVAAATRDWGAPALAIAVVHGDSTVFAKGYGVAEVGKPARATEHTRFAVGSTTKAMTTAALAMLVDEGKLRWDDRVIDHIPELRLQDPYATRELTVRDILLHRSGLPGTDMFWAVAENQPPLSEVVERLRFIAPTSSFRSTWAYQNVVYAIGGLLVERVSGRKWEDFLRERLFAPLGMRATEPLVADIRGKPDVAVPHARVRDTIRPVPIRSTDVVASAGSVYSSVADMSRWLRFMLDSGRVGSRRLITPETFDDIVTPQISVAATQYPALELARPSHFSYGLGWFIQDYDGEPVWMHTGSIDGMSAIVGLLPRRKVGVVVLANLDHVELRHALMYQAFDLFTDGPDRDWSRDLKALFDRRAAAARTAQSQAAAPAGSARPSLPLERYAGTYAHPAYGEVEIRLENGALYLRYGNHDAGLLEHVTYEVFRARPRRPGAAPTSVTFQPDGTGGVSAVRAFNVAFTRTRR